ncbi:TetR/AcrR family transcriptional regulator [Catenuloplanes sp. NPDC051500]|uniref:TetR/AcrR family transcriptional regulator n=1 Tax=Catenuloplanes sp. NPDC051500 TaxID=3363959 RepID=UPI0037A77604
MSTIDRRTAIKTRHRAAIIDAATALISEGGSVRFSVDELAARADVSRRTIFNHFASIDDVVTTACTEALGVVIGDFRAAFSASPVEPGSRASMFEAVTTALRATDVPSVIAFLWQALGGFDAGDQRPQQIFQATFSRTTDEIARELADRHADADSLDAELLVSSLMHGIEVIAHRWIAETGATTGVAARAQWSVLLERLIDNIRTGY